MTAKTMITKTDPSELRAGDRVYVAGNRAPVTVVSVAGTTARCVQKNGRTVWATQAAFDRVLNTMSEVIR